MPLGLLTFTFLILYIIYFGINISKNYFKIFAWISLVVFFSFVRSDDVDLTANLTRMINFTIAFLAFAIFYEEKYDKFPRDLYFVISPLPYVCILTFILANITPSLFVYLSNETQSMYSFLLLMNYSSSMGGYLGDVRPISIFWEPGVFQIYLNILLYMQFTFNKRFYVILSTVLAILLTQSTIGMAIAFSQILYFVFFVRDREVSSWSKLAVILILLMASPVIYNIVFQNFYDKFFGNLSGSASARQFDFELALNIIINNPIFGIGFSPFAYVQESASFNISTYALATEDQYIRNNTNGIMMVLYWIGLPLGIYYLYSLFSQRIFEKKFIASVIVFGSLLSSPLAFTPFFLMLGFSGMIQFRVQR
jgi:hypothetical protein